MNTLPELALSIRQPWAYAIMNLGKDIENRRWRPRTHTPFDICIHAALGVKRHEMTDAFEFIDKAAPMPSPREALRRQNTILNDARHGGIVAVATVTDIVTESDSPWFTGPYGWVLENVRPVDFIPVRGALGLFPWRDRIERAAGVAALMTSAQQSH